MSFDKERFLREAKGDFKLRVTKKAFRDQTYAPEGYVTMAQAARLSGLSLNYFWIYWKTGRLDHLPFREVKIARFKKRKRKIFFELTALQEAIAKNRVSPRRTYTGKVETGAQGPQHKNRRVRGKQPYYSRPTAWGIDKAPMPEIGYLRTSDATALLGFTDASGFRQFVKRRGINRRRPNETYYHRAWPIEMIFNLMQEKENDREKNAYRILARLRDQSERRNVRYDHDALQRHVEGVVRSPYRWPETCDVAEKETPQD